MTADEFLRDLAKRVQSSHVQVFCFDGEGRPSSRTGIQLNIPLTSYDADEFLALTGIRVE